MSASIAICHVNAAVSEWAGTCMVGQLCFFFFFFFGGGYLFSFGNVDLLRTVGSKFALFFSDL